MVSYPSEYIAQESPTFGLYEDNARTFSDAEIGQAIELPSKVRGMLEESWVTPHPFQLAGVNMPDDIKPDE